MKIIIALLLSMISAQGFSENYGAELTLSKSLSVEQAIASLAMQSSAKRSKPVLIEGTIDSVCQVKGCWMGFNSEAGKVRVTFKDYGFFVPFSILGKTVQAQGLLEKVTLSLGDSKHLVEDDGGDPSSVTEPIVEYQLVASGVVVP